MSLLQYKLSRSQKLMASHCILFLEPDEEKVWHITNFPFSCSLYIVLKRVTNPSRFFIEGAFALRYRSKINDTLPHYFLFRKDMWLFSYEKQKAINQFMNRQLNSWRVACQFLKIVAPLQGFHFHRACHGYLKIQPKAISFFPISYNNLVDKNVPKRDLPFIVMNLQLKNFTGKFAHPTVDRNLTLPKDPLVRYMIAKYLELQARSIIASLESEGKVVLQLSDIPDQPLYTLDNKHISLCSTVVTEKFMGFESKTDFPFKIIPNATFNDTQETPELKKIASESSKSKKEK